MPHFSLYVRGLSSFLTNLYIIFAVKFNNETLSYLQTLTFDIKLNININISDVATVCKSLYFLQDSERTLWTLCMAIHSSTSAIIHSCNFTLISPPQPPTRKHREANLKFSSLPRVRRERERAVGVCTFVFFVFI